MGRKGLISLGLVSVAMVAAYGFYAARQAPTELRAEGALLPALNLAALSAIAYEEDGQRIRLARKEGVWVVPEKDDYPASGAAVAELLQSLKETQKIEARTANAELHARLGLAESGTEQAARLTLEGEPSLTLLLGNRSSQDGQLMRFKDDNQAWLVKPALNLPVDSKAWLDRRITDIAFAEVKSVVVTLSSGERLAVSREQNQPNMQVEGLAADTKLAFESAANGMATVFDGLLFEDAKPLAELTLAKARAQFELTTLTGQRLTGELHQSGEQHWLVIGASEGFEKAQVTAREGFGYLLEPRHFQALTHNLKAVLNP